MQSRVTTVVSPEKRQPSAFKAVCLLNTDFMVDFLGYFTRDDFEKYLQLTCKRMNQLILTHFHSKPYRYLEDVTLFCNPNVNCMTMCLSKPANKCDLTTPNHINSNFAFSKMFSFLDKTVRVPKVQIWISHITIIEQENIDQLKSLSHIWENAQVEFTTSSYTKENLVSRAELLNETELFRCRRFKCTYSDNAYSDGAMLPLWDYPEIYALGSVEVHFTTLESMESYAIVQLVENQALYPQSKTTFVFSETKYRFLPLCTNTVLRHIHNKFMESEKAQSFKIVFAVKEGFEVSDGEMDEFRLENNLTREVLRMQYATHNEVAKYCEFNAKTKYFILERSNV